MTLLVEKTISSSVLGEIGIAQPVWHWAALNTRRVERWQRTCAFVKNTATAVVDSHLKAKRSAGSYSKAGIHRCLIRVTTCNRVIVVWTDTTALQRAMDELAGAMKICVWS